MDPARLIPAAEALPSPWGWLEALLVVTFALHALFMNLAVGSAAIALAGRLTRRQEDLARELGRRLPTLFALTVNLGVAPLLFAQALYGQLLYTSSVLMACWWLSGIAALILGYYGLYAQQALQDARPGLSRLVLALSLALFASVGFLLSNNMTLMLRPQAWAAYFQHPGGTLLNLADPMLWPRYTHMLLAAPAVAGLYAALLGEKKRRPDWTAHGLAWFTRLTMLQILVGGWLLASLPEWALPAFMGRSPLATALLAAGVLAGLGALFAGLKGRVGPAAWLTGLTLLLMAGVRSQLRLATLAPAFSPGSLASTGELSPLLLFAACLGFGVWAMLHMLRTYAKGAAKSAGRG